MGTGLKSPELNEEQSMKSRIVFLLQPNQWVEREEGREKFFAQLIIQAVLLWKPSSVSPIIAFLHLSQAAPPLALESMPVKVWDQPNLLLCDLINMVCIQTVRRFMTKFTVFTCTDTHILSASEELFWQLKWSKVTVCLVWFLLFRL